MKNLTLHSFGDSFTYGDGLFPIPAGSSDQTIAMFDNKREKKTYTGLLANEFKNTINHGLPSNNNEFMLTQMLEVIHDPDFIPDNNFFIINLTDPARVGVAAHNSGNNVVYSLANVHSIEHMTPAFNNKRVANEVIGTLFDDIANIHRYYTTLSSILHLMENTGVRYYMFSGINTIDDASTPESRMTVLSERIKSEFYSPPDRALSNDKRMKKDILELYNEMIHKFKHYDLFKNTLDPWVGLDWDESIQFYKGDISVCHSMTKLMDVYATKKYDNPLYYISHLVLECGHWNQAGHKLVANIILSRIKKQNYDYL